MTEIEKQLKKQAFAGVVGVLFVLLYWWVLNQFFPLPLGGGAGLMGVFGWLAVKSAWQLHKHKQQAK